MEVCGRWAVWCGGRGEKHHAGCGARGQGKGVGWLLGSPVRIVLAAPLISEVHDASESHSRHVCH